MNNPLQASADALSDQAANVIKKLSVYQLETKDLGELVLARDAYESERAKAAAPEHPMKCKHDIPLNLGCDKCGRYESFSQPEAKPVAADWIDSVAREFSNWLENEGCGVDLFSDCRDIVMKHAPAQDSRDSAITALKQIFAWWDANDGHLVTHFPTPVRAKMESFRAAMSAEANKTNFPL